MKNIQIKIGGFGGQGIVLAGYILGKAASIHDKKNATLTQSYGPESRGSSFSAQLIIGNDEIDPQGQPSRYFADHVPGSLR